MKISIENFKSIRSLQNFEIRPFTILSGVNSAGKSSFVQLLLLLKQTIEGNNSKQPFLLKGELYEVRELKDIINNRDISRKLCVSFEFSKSEIEQFDNLNTISVFNALGNYNCIVKIKYDITKNNEMIIALFSVKFKFDNGKEQFIVFKSNFDNNFSIDTNTAIFGKQLYFDKPTITKIHFSSIYPDKYEYNKEEDLEMGDREATSYEHFKEIVNINDIKLLINTFLQNISYIEPNRKAPEDEYIYSKSRKSIGTKGQFIAQIIEEKATFPTEFYKIIELENGLKYECENNKTLIEAVKYWMCDVFEVAEDIKTEKVNENYKIILINKSGLKTSIKHVGFGISQLLPIVVEGLLMSKNGTLIVEQPEIHLHPKIQSKLFDFFSGLIKQGKKVIIETHSSHFITRMRRRIAEDESNKMDDTIGLTFIEGDVFRSIELDDYGTMEYYPDDFIEQSNIELKAIVKAQMRKHKRND